MISRVLFLLIFILGFGASLRADTLASAPRLADLQAGARQGDAWAQLNLGAAYEHGIGPLGADPQMAVYWYRRAARQGLALAQFNFGHSLVTGFGGTEDAVQGRVWMRKAAQAGLMDAQFLYGLMLLQGLGGPADQAAAASWLRLADRQGHPEAGAYLEPESGHPRP